MSVRARLILVIGDAIQNLEEGFAARQSVCVLVVVRTREEVWLLPRRPGDRASVGSTATIYAVCRSAHGNPERGRAVPVGEAEHLNAGMHHLDRDLRNQVLPVIGRGRAHHECVVLAEHTVAIPCFAGFVPLKLNLEVLAGHDHSLCGGKLHRLPDNCARELERWEEHGERVRDVPAGRLVPVERDVTVPRNVASRVFRAGTRDGVPDGVDVRVCNVDRLPHRTIRLEARIVLGSRRALVAVKVDEDRVVAVECGARGARLRVYPTVPVHVADIRERFQLVLRAHDCPYLRDASHRLLNHVVRVFGDHDDAPDAALDCPVEAFVPVPEVDAVRVVVCVKGERGVTPRIVDCVIHFTLARVLGGDRDHCAGVVRVPWYTVDEVRVVGVLDERAACRPTRLQFVTLGGHRRHDGLHFRQDVRHNRSLFLFKIVAFLYKNTTR